MHTQMDKTKEVEGNSFLGMDLPFHSPKGQGDIIFEPHSLCHVGIGLGVDRTDT